MNVYIHFPFCRAKCTYCALLSRAGSDDAARRRHVERCAREVRQYGKRTDGAEQTVYFGGGTPALCDLTPLFDAVSETMGTVTEWTVELHPHDVTEPLLAQLRAGGVNRISLGVQSFSDGVLAEMNRGYAAAEARAAFQTIRAAGFQNAGLDLIAGWPGVTDEMWRRTLDAACALEPVHMSVYTLIREPGTLLDRRVRQKQVVLPDDASALNHLALAQARLADAGLARYEVSSFARPGFACRHNLAVWRGEDYIGIGEGAHGRQGRQRTVARREGWETTELETDVDDARERALFALRLTEGLDLGQTVQRWPCLRSSVPAWRRALTELVPHGIVRSAGSDRFALTARGFEVCDAVMASLLEAETEAR